MPNASSTLPGKKQSGPMAANGLRAVVPTRRRPARMGALATVPLFAKLAGRRVLVAGSGEGAAWKAELLCAAGAHVLLVRDGSNELHCGEARELVGGDNGTPPGATEGASSEDGLGTVTLAERAWQAADLFGSEKLDTTGIAPDRPAFALIDTPCHGEAASFAALARAAGVLVNAIDKPSHGDVQFGSIVNRSPVVIGISTDGAAPILGQAIRQRIEVLLPPSLAQWAGAMRAARGRVLSLMPGKRERRAFFERFADAAFRLPFPSIQRGLVPGGGEPDPILELAEGSDPVIEGDTASPTAPLDQTADHGAFGHVTLVGAGPGDAELLTLKAVRALQGADVVLFDALVSEDVLELARREAKRMLVGKRAGRESCRQEDINALMLKLAGPGPQGGKRVVRLKSGDPMVFGRAGEEIEALRAASIPHAVVPGVTTAQALAASLNISLTHRQHARSIRFITGHGANGQLPSDHDWSALADPATTLVVYMGARTAPLIAERLIDEGMPPHTPTVAAASVGRTEQQSWHGTLAALAAGVQTLPHDQPIVIAIGNALEANSAAVVDWAIEAGSGAEVARNVG